LCTPYKWRQGAKWPHLVHAPKRELRRRSGLYVRRGRNKQNFCSLALNFTAKYLLHILYWWALQDCHIMPWVRCVKAFYICDFTSTCLNLTSRLARVI